MIDTKALRNKILDAAIRGKLTEQLPEDGNVEELYNQIQEEKQTLIKEGKIKKEKSLPPITEDELPFEIPENWKWVRVDNIFNVRSAMRIHQTDWRTVGVPFFRGRELVELSKSGNLTPEIYIDSSLYETLKRKGGVPQKDDILISAVGTIGKTYVVKGTKPFYYKDAYILCLENYGNLDSSYIKNILDGPYCQEYIKKDSMAVTVAQLTIIKLKSMIIPLPPLAEQQRIGRNIELLFSWLDVIDEIQSKLSDNSVALKNKIIELGIQGKLTEQLPEDGNAEDLYKQIQEEKQRLIKEGKIKKDKNESYIFRRDNSHYEKLGDSERCIDDEIPFDIPDNWKWVYLGEVFSHNTGKVLNQSNSEGVPMTYITTSNVYWNGFILDNLCVMNFKESEIGKCTIRKDDLLVCEGGDIGRSAIWPYDYEMRIQNHIHKLRAYIPLDIKYYWYVLFLYKTAGWIGGKGIGIQGLSSNVLHKMIIPLPPFEEQKRIVKRLDSLHSLVDNL